MLSTTRVAGSPSNLFLASCPGLEPGLPLAGVSLDEGAVLPKGGLSAGLTA